MNALTSAGREGTGRKACSSPPARFTMKSSAPTLLTRWLAVAGLAAVQSVLALGCSSSSTTDNGSPAGAGGAGTGTGSGGGGSSNSGVCASPDILFPLQQYGEFDLIRG